MCQLLALQAGNFALRQTNVEQGMLSLVLESR